MEFVESVMDVILQLVLLQKLEKQLELWLHNQLENQVLSLLCVHSIQVVLQVVMISLKVFLVLKNYLKLVLQNIKQQYLRLMVKLSILKIKVANIKLWLKMKQVFVNISLTTIQNYVLKKEIQLQQVKSLLKVQSLQKNCLQLQILLLLRNIS